MNTEFIRSFAPQWRCFGKTAIGTPACGKLQKKRNVALGMVNHYFGSKETLGAQVLSLLDTYAVGG